LRRPPLNQRNAVTAAAQGCSQGQTGQAAANNDNIHLHAAIVAESVQLDKAEQKTA
jgi:hypothetical protein